MDGRGRRGTNGSVKRSSIKRSTSSGSQKVRRAGRRVHRETDRWTGRQTHSQTHLEELVGQQEENVQTFQTKLVVV